MVKYYLVLILFFFSSIANAELKITVPSDVCNILNESGLSTGAWKDNYGWGCNSRYKEVGAGSPLANNIAYYVDGDKNSVTQAKLVLNVNNKSMESSAISFLLSSAEKLSIKLTGEKLPQNINNALKQAKSEKSISGKTVIEVKRDDWPTGKGYEVHIIFK